MAETHEGQQRQARPQPELAAAAASAADLLSTATPSTPAPPSPAAPGTASASGDSAEELTAHVAPKALPLPAEQHRPHHHQHHQQLLSPPQAAIPEKEDTEELRELGAPASLQTIPRTTSQTAAATDSSVETHLVREGLTQPLSSQGRVGLTPGFVPGTELESGSKPEAVSESRLEPREELASQAVDAKVGIVVAAHEQERGEQQQLQPPRDPTPRQPESSTKIDTPLSTTTPTTTPSILSSLTTSPAATATVTSTVTNGTESTGQPNGHVSTSASPSPAPGAMSNLPSQFSGSPRPQQQQQAPLVNYAPQSTYVTAATTGLNTQYGYAGTGTQPNDVYRADTNVANSAMSLPSMRTFDRAQQTQQQQRPQQHGHTPIAMSHAMTSPVTGNVGYYQQQPAPLTSNNTYGMAPDTMGGHRYPLPPNDPRSVLAGTRHKKVG